MDPRPTLVCFAVKEEAKYFKPESCRVLITGIGQENATKALRKVLTVMRPELVLTCGFAGGLDPELKIGNIVFDAGEAVGLEEKLSRLGAVPARFHCAPHVAITVSEKSSLRKSTGTDAVEMESFAIRAICREQKIPAATIRVISDTAGENLPLNFNELMTPDYRINIAKLIGRLLRGPNKIPQLIKFQKQTVFAARQLDKLLEKLLAGG